MEQRRRTNPESRAGLEVSEAYKAADLSPSASSSSVTAASLKSNW